MSLSDTTSVSLLNFEQIDYNTQYFPGKNVQQLDRTFWSLL